LWPHDLAKILRDRVREFDMQSFASLRGAALALLALALGGCASMGKDECLAMDWRTVGYEDGATGQGVERLSSRRQACAKHGVAPDLDAYRMGREEGLLEYCRPENGFRVGASGRGYGGACPAHLATAFTDSYEAGRHLWRLERQVSDTIGGIAARRGEIQRIDEMLVSSGLLILGETTTTEERAQALLHTNSLTERRSRLAVEIDGLERALPAYEAELEDYRRQLFF
jgi:hypothetical protein